MKNLLATIALIATILASGTALGQAEKGRQTNRRLGTKLDAVALNAAAASRTFNIGAVSATNTNPIAAGYRWLLLKIAFTHANNGTLTILCDDADDATGTTNYTMTTCSTASGACTLNFVTGATTSTLTGDKNFSVRLDIAGHGFLECSVTHNGTPAAGDVVSVTAELVAG